MESTKQLSYELSRTSVKNKGSAKNNVLKWIFPEWIVKKYWSNRKTWAFCGVVLGASILTLLIQSPATAQLFSTAEADTDVIQTYLPGLGTGMAFIFQAFRLLFFGGGATGIVGGGYNYLTNRGWESWLNIGVALVLMGALMYALENLVYGAGGGTLLD